jgi:hypothetical protein
MQLDIAKGAALAIEESDKKSIRLRRWVPMPVPRARGEATAVISRAPVFVAHVVRTEEAKELSLLSSEPEPIVEVTFRLVETLKGQPPPVGKVKSLVFSNGN